MDTETHWSQDMPMPVLLAEARLTYASAIRSAFANAGFDDMPRAGARVIGRIAVGGTNVNEVAAVYGVSKQAASQLVDSLVARGYVERSPDEQDRRQDGRRPDRARRGRRTGAQGGDHGRRRCARGRVLRG